MLKTLENLSKAFVGESQARNRYTFYARAAQKEGYEQIAEIFTLTAEQEKTHAKRLFEHIQDLKKTAEAGLGADGKIEIPAEVPTVYATTAENLAAAIAGETHEYDIMYPEFATQAETDNLPVIAARLRAIAEAEKHHRERYQAILDQLQAGAIFKKSAPTQWVCRECGYPHTGPEAPLKCPSCDHPQAFYQVRCKNY